MERKKERKKAKEREKERKKKPHIGRFVHFLTRSYFQYSLFEAILLQYLARSYLYSNTYITTHTTTHIRLHIINQYNI